MVYLTIVIMLIAGMVGILRGLLLFVWLTQPRRSSRTRWWYNTPRRRPWFALRALGRGMFVILLAIGGRILLEVGPEDGDIGVQVVFLVFAGHSIAWMLHV